MRTLSSLLCAGAAACVLAGAALAADTAETAHEMLVRMPDGGVAEIRYTGPVAPQVTFGAPTLRSLPSAEFERSFAAFNDLSRALDREVEVLLDRSQVPRDVVLPDADSLLQASLANGAGHGRFFYSWTSTTVGDRTCTRKVEISGTPGERQPKIVKQSAGDCRNDATDSFKADWPLLRDPGTPRDQATGLRTRTRKSDQTTL